VLLARAGAGKPEETPAAADAAAVIGERVTLAPALWLDADVRWLTGVHEAEGHDYLVRERYEELLWWLLMPSLLRLAGEAAPSRAAVLELSASIEEALATAETAGYRVDLLLRPSITEADNEEPAAEAKPATGAAAIESELAEEPSQENAEASESATEAQPLPIEEREPAEPEIEPPAEPVAKPTEPVWPPLA
jgi:hypothetical protein